MNLTPLGNHIIVAPAEKEAKTASGIYLPQTGDKERPEQGKVVAVGPGKLMENGTRQAVDVKVGDTVVFKKYAPDEVTIDNVDYLVLSADDVIAIVEEKQRIF